VRERRGHAQGLVVTRLAVLRVHVLRRHLVEVGDVGLIAHLRHEGHGRLALFQIRPVHLAEPRVLEDLFDARLAAAQPRARVTVKQPADQVLGVFGDVAVE